MTDAPAAPIALDASSRRVQLAVLWALGILAVAAFAVAYPGLVWVGTELAHLPVVVAYVLPVVIDAGLLTLGLAAAVKRSQRRPAWLEFAGLGLLVAVSIVAQIAHVAAASTSSGWFPIVGGVVAASAPLTLLLAVESALRAVLVEPVKRTRRAPKPAPKRAATAPTPAPSVKPANQSTTRETGAVTDGQRSAATGRFGDIPGYRERLEQYLREGTPTPRMIGELDGMPSRTTVQADARVLAAELALV